MCGLRIASLAAVVATVWACRTRVENTALRAGESGGESSCSAQWEAFSAEPYQEIALPDTAVSYWRYRFKVAQGQAVMLRVSAPFPDGRYASYSIYDQVTMDSTGVIADYKLTPDSGVNPFTPGARAAAQTRYTLSVAPKNALIQGQNVLRMPEPKAAGDQYLELWYRIYLGKNSKGGIELPEITALTADAAETPLPCPEHATQKTGFAAAASSLLPLSESAEIRAYRPASSGVYGNPDNVYVSSRLDFRKGEIALVRFKAPTVAAPKDGQMAESGDVRYYSVCIGGISTRTSSCLSDRDLRINPDGFVTVAVGPEALEKEITRRGINFLPRGKLLVPLLIYRNLLTRQGFAGDYRKVPEWKTQSGTEADDLVTRAADRAVGDFGPRGEHLTLAKFLERFPAERGPGGDGATALAQEKAPSARAGQADLQHVSLAVGWEYLLPAGVYNMLSKAETSPDAASKGVAALEVVMRHYFSARLGFTPLLDVGSPDIIARQLVTGERDLALVPGLTFAWMQRQYPELRILAFSSGSGQTQGGDSTLFKPDERDEILLVAHKDSIITGAADLPGKVISMGPSTRYKTLAGMELYFEKAGVPLTRSVHMPNPWPADMDELINTVAQPSQAGKMALFIDRASLEAYKFVLPGAVKQLKVFASVAKLPADVLVYAPKRWRETDLSQVRAAIQAPIKKAEAFVVDLMRSATGTGYMALPNAELERAFDDLKTELRYPDEYKFPFGFYVE